MDGSHKAVRDAPIVVQHFCQGGQAVGGAGGVGNDVQAFIIGCVIHPHNEHGRIILGGRGHDHLFRACLQMSLRLILLQKQARGLHNILRADLTPGNFRGLELVKHLDFGSVYHKRILGVADLALKPAVNRVVSEHIRHIVRRHAGIVYAHKLYVRMVQASAKHQASDPSEAVDSNFDAHLHCLLFLNCGRIKPLCPVRLHYTLRSPHFKDAKH
ncbi:hypothetical protein SDC9_123602 [bioreactor metagenome]|uniref:Uncharacterized protein n=1 Tax=bioreactor metagenome TaxID=1076179 RepID=A0A645CI24_9ZZZZ